MKSIEHRLDGLSTGQSQLKEAYGRLRAQGRRIWLRPPMWTYEQHPPRYEQHPPRQLDLRILPATPVLSKQPPRIAIVTPSFDHGRFIRTTIESVLTQDYPNLSYLVQDGGSGDDTIEILKGYGDRISWRSEVDYGQSDAINKGFKDIDCDIMAAGWTSWAGFLVVVQNIVSARAGQPVRASSSCRQNHEALVRANSRWLGRSVNLAAPSPHGLRHSPRRL